MRLASLFAPALITLAGMLPVSAATVSDPSASVSMFAGDIIAEAYAPVSTALGFDPTYALIAGGISGFDPAFVLSLEDASGEALYGEASGYSFDGDKKLSFVFEISGPMAALFGSTALVTLSFGDTIADPFGSVTDLMAMAELNIAAADVAPVPLPATLPLLVAAFGGSAALLRRRRHA